MRNKKGIAFFSIASSTVALGGFAATACEDDKPSTFNGGQDEASFDSGGSFNTDANSTGDVKGPVTCNPSFPSTFAPAWKAPATKASQCTNAQLGEYYDACLPNVIDAKCTQWLNANKACGDCIEPDDNSGPIQLYNNRSFYLLNLAGCIASAQGKSGEKDCGGQYGIAAQCRVESCADCFSKGGTFDNFTTCQIAAAKDPTTCKTYEESSAKACGTNAALKDPDGGAPQCFQVASDKEGTGGLPSKDHFTRVFGIMCGT
jgi:hypothetical protein